MPVKRAVEILLVEDNPGDVQLVEEALSTWSTRTRLTLVDDGDKAIDYLRRAEAGDPAAKLPDLVLLDLNLPKKSGLEILRAVKTRGRLSSVPIIVLTSSKRKQDVQGAYDLHANCYLMKSADLDEFFDRLRALEKFWLQHAQLPTF